MEENLVEKSKMQADFDGIIILLAKNLYSDANIFIRELIQNAHDAIQIRRSIDVNLAGRIEIFFDKENSTITCRDNGIGMDVHDIKEHLATIGASGKRIIKATNKDEALANSLIGQFGIGLLSAFIVSDKVSVKTKKQNSEKSYRWENQGSLDYNLYEIEMAAIGTEVILHIKREFDYLLNEKFLTDVIKKYCCFIPMGITLNGSQRINDIEVPIYKTNWENDSEKRAKFSLFINRRYESTDLPLDIIPFRINGDYSAAGVLYLSSKTMPDDSSGVVDVFIRRVFIKENDPSLLPQWAKFVKGVIDSPDLQPTASRDNIRINHPSYEYIKNELGKIIIERLIEISKNEPERFEKINQWHHYHLKGMACKHSDFFEATKDLLLFETNKGFLPLPVYFTKNDRKAEHNNKKSIYFFPYRGKSALFNTLSKEKDITIINASGVYDEEFLGLYSTQDSDSVLINLEFGDGAFFEELNYDEQNKFYNLIENADLILNSKISGNVQIEVSVKKYAPEWLPAVVINDKKNVRNKQLEAIADFQSMYSGIDSIAQEFLKASNHQIFHLTLNASNSLIQSLLKTEDLFKEDTKNIFIGLFNAAIIYSQNLLSEEHLNAIYNHFVSTFSLLLDYQNKIIKLQGEVERNRLAENVKNKSEWWNAPVEKDSDVEHIVFFVIMPFSDELNSFFEAIKLVFESEPYHFEVIRADEKVFKGNLLENIIEHYKRADGFIVEMSKLNPNVFYELGTLSPFESKRNILKFRSDKSDPIPSDLNGILYYKYNSNSDPKIIADQIRHLLFKDGSFSNEELENLLKKRSKRYFSKVLFGNKIETNPEDHLKNKIVSEYKNIETFLAEDTSIILTKTGIAKSKIEAIKDDLFK